jgi:hypothetical protein
MEHDKSRRLPNSAFAPSISTLLAISLPQCPISACPATFLGRAGDRISPQSDTAFWHVNLDDMVAHRAK